MLTKIALLSDGIFPYVLGGMQKHSYYLTKYLAQSKIHVQLYFFTQNNFWKGGILDGFTESDMQYITPVHIEFPKSDGFPGHYLRASYKYSEKIYNHLSGNSDIDFIYAKGFSAWKLLKEKKKGFRYPPIGVNFHGYEMFQKTRSLKSLLEQWLLLRRPVKFHLGNSDFIFSYGGKISSLIRNQGFSESKIIEIPAGIEESWISSVKSPIGNPKRFVFSGRFETRKGLDELNSTLRRLIHEKAFEFHFIGPIPESKKVYSEKIVYHGIISEETEMKKLLASMDILVCPSHSEGMPNVILEAMASGLSVIATDVGATSKLVSSENGWLIKPFSIMEIFHAMLEAMASSEEAINGKKKTSLKMIKENFLWSDIIQTTIKKMEAAVEQHGKANDK